MSSIEMHAKYPGWHVQVQTVMGKWIDAPSRIFDAEMLLPGAAKRSISPYVNIRSSWSRFGWEDAKAMMALTPNEQMARLTANLAIERASK